MECRIKNKEKHQNVRNNVKNIIKKAWEKSKEESNEMCKTNNTSLWNKIKEMKGREN